MMSRSKETYGLSYVWSKLYHFFFKQITVKLEAYLAEEIRIQVKKKKKKI